MNQSQSPSQSLIAIQPFKIQPKMKFFISILIVQYLIAFITANVIPNSDEDQDNCIKSKIENLNKKENDLEGGELPESVERIYTMASGLCWPGRFEEVFENIFNERLIQSDKYEDDNDRDGIRKCMERYLVEKNVEGKLMDTFDKEAAKNHEVSTECKETLEKLENDGEECEDKALLAVTYARAFLVSASTRSPDIVDDERKRFVETSMKAMENEMKCLIDEENAKN